MDAQALLILAGVGLVAGFLASAVLGGRGNVVRYLVLGVAGAFVGAALQRYAGLGVDLGNALASQIAMATIGAVALGVVARLLG